MQEKKDQIILLVVTSVILLFSPLVLEFHSTSTWLQLPAVFVYVFVVWAGIILCTFLISRKKT